MNLTQSFFAGVLETATNLQMSAVSALELILVIGARKREPGLAILDEFMKASGLRIRPFDEEQLTLAKDAWLKFGKGRHPAALNLGDCCSYALAKATGEPLIYKGQDFSRTDITSFNVL